MGDPHIHTLDGNEFDLYDKGTYSVFHYGGTGVSVAPEGCFFSFSVPAGAWPDCGLFVSSMTCAP